MHVKICDFAEAGRTLACSLLAARQERHLARLRGDFYQRNVDVRWDARKVKKVAAYVYVMLKLMLCCCMQPAYVFRCADLYSIDSLV